ncbi:MAG TPA: hypothetical protein VMD59_20165 [Acidimicrobiales bacterium]|nr:hypothetical protein [Acidimicrobiales bacterium]
MPGELSDLQWRSRRCNGTRAYADSKLFDAHPPARDVSVREGRLAACAGLSGGELPPAPG